MKRHYLYALFCFLLMNISGWAAVYTFDFENTEENAHWHFVNGSQTNKWIIYPHAGSNGSGSYAMYVSSGVSYAYNKDAASTVWTYCDEVLTGDIQISFDWKGTGEGGYDYMYAYLVPTDGTQPTAGSPTPPTNAIQIGERFNDQSSWTTYTDNESTLSGTYYLYFMWYNDASSGGTPIAIDNVRIQTEKTLPPLPANHFTILSDSVSQSKAVVKALYETESTTVERVGYTVAGDTVWMPNATDTIVCALDSLHPHYEYNIHFLAEDSIDGDTDIFTDYCTQSPYVNGWSSNDSAWNHVYEYYGCSHYVHEYNLAINNNSWLYRPIYLEAGIPYEIQCVTWFLDIYGQTEVSMDTICVAIGNSVDTAQMTILQKINPPLYTGSCSPIPEPCIIAYTPDTSGIYYIGLQGIATYMPIYVGCVNVTCPPYRTLGFYERDTTVITRDIEVSMESVSATQGSLHVRGTYNAGDALLGQTNGIKWRAAGESYTFIPFNKADSAGVMDTIITGLEPSTDYTFRMYFDLADSTQVTSSMFTLTTDSIRAYCSLSTPQHITQSTCGMHVSFDLGDLPIGTNKGIEFKKTSSYGGYNNRIVLSDSLTTFDTIVSGLMPETEYYFRAYYTDRNGSTTYSEVLEVTTRSIVNSITFGEPTQTTIPFTFKYDAGDAKPEYTKVEWISDNGDRGSIYYYSDTTFTAQHDTVLTNLVPNETYELRASVYFENTTIRTDYLTIQTLPVTVGEPQLVGHGQTYLEIGLTNDYGNATLVREEVEFSTDVLYQLPDTTIALTNGFVKYNNLYPGMHYFYRAVLETEEAGVQHSPWVEVQTKYIGLQTDEADGITNTAATLHGSVDCDQESYTEVGFEWIRSDAPETVHPYRILITDRTDEQLAFRIVGLSRDHYYNFRTYCKYQTQTYYGEWVGFLTTDAEETVAPYVETLGASVDGQGVLMEGYAKEGTEPFLQIGFESWEKGSSIVRTTIVENSVMKAYMPETQSYHTYQFRAYAKTPAGVTYGETLEVEVGYIEQDIPNVVVVPSIHSAEFRWSSIKNAGKYSLLLFDDIWLEHKVDEATLPSSKTSYISEGLFANTTYYFAVRAYNEQEQMIAEEIGSFTTLKEEMGMQEAEAGSEAGVQKVLRDGQVLIIRNGKAYTMMGKEVLDAK